MTRAQLTDGEWEFIGPFLPVGRLEAARRDEIDMSLASVDSTTTRAHHDAAGIRVSEETLAALEEAVSQKGERPRNKADRTAKATRSAPNADASAADGGPG